MKRTSRPYRKSHRAYAQPQGKNGQRLLELTVKLYSPLPTCTCDDGRTCETCRAYGELGQALGRSLAVFEQTGNSKAPGGQCLAPNVGNT